MKQCIAPKHFAFAGCAYGTEKCLFDVVREDGVVKDGVVKDVGLWRFCIIGMVGLERM